MYCGDFYTCKVVCFVINQVQDNYSEAQRSHDFAAFNQVSIKSYDG